MNLPTSLKAIYIIGITLLLAGCLHIILPNDSQYHDPLQVVLAIGSLLIGIAVFLDKRRDRNKVF